MLPPAYPEHGRSSGSSRRSPRKGGSGYDVALDESVLDGSGIGVETPFEAPLRTATGEGRDVAEGVSGS